MKLISKISFLILVALIGLNPINAKASGISLSVQPSQVEYSGKPGTSNINYISVINKGDSQVKLKVRVEDFKYTDENGNIAFYIASSDSALTWLIPQYLEMVIPPYGAKTVQYIISIPKGTKPGGHLGAINLELESATGTDAGALLNKKFGTLVFLNVIDSGITTGGTITDFSTPKFQYTGSPKLNLLVKNSGNANLFANGSVTFTDWQGKNVGQFATNSVVVAPNNSRLFGINWTDNNLFGFYKAQISLTNSIRSDQKLLANTWFIVLPWQKIIVFVPLILLLAIALFFVFMRARQGKRILNPPSKIIKSLNS